MALGWNQSGKMFELSNSHSWLAGVPREEWPADTPDEVVKFCQDGKFAELLYCAAH